jgi:hypothetical protein
MEILGELAEYVDNGVVGPHIRMLQKHSSDEELTRGAKHLLLLIKLYVAPAASRKALSGLKEFPSACIPLRRLIAALPSLHEVFEITEHSDIFRPTIPTAERERIVKYVHEHWHPIVET